MLNWAALFVDTNSVIQTNIDVMSGLNEADRIIMIMATRPSISSVCSLSSCGPHFASYSAVSMRAWSCFGTWFPFYLIG